MRSPDEQQIALECLKLAQAATYVCGTAMGQASRHGSAEEVTGRASSYFAFVTGCEVEDAAGKLAAIRKAAA